MNSRALALKPENTGNLETPPPDTSSVQEGVSPLTKQYVVPPRPKPGRKPATDTPPTRRKAQNRAAQRAFRERRAAKVHLLEDELAEMRRKHEAEVARLRYERDMHMKNVESYYNDSLQNLRKEVSSLLERTTSLPAPLPTGTRTTGISDEEAQRSYQTPPAMQDGCGNCTVDSSCPCVEDAFEVNVAAETKRLPSPHPDQDRAKRSRILPVQELETDFTSMAPPPLPVQRQLTISDTQKDPCGFCASDNDCLCEEIIAGSAAGFDTEVKVEQESPGLIDTSCADGPGSCDTCQTNPVVSILCQTFNRSQSPEMARRPAPRPEAAPCALGEACCQVSDTIAENTSRENAGTVDPESSISGLTIPCDTAFAQLQKHRAFEQATKDLPEWMHLLKTREITRQTGSVGETQPLEVDHTTRSYFEIEAASVLSVLQYYDIRYGTGES